MALGLGIGFRHECGLSTMAVAGCGLIVGFFFRVSVKFLPMPGCCMHSVHSLPVCPVEFCFVFSEMLAVWEIYVIPGLSLAAVASLSIAWLTISHIYSSSLAHLQFMVNLGIACLRLSSTRGIQVPGKMFWYKVWIAGMSKTSKFVGLENIATCCRTDLCSVFLSFLPPP